MNNLKFRDELKIRIYKFIIKLLKTINDLSDKDTISRTVKDQLIRSGASIGANYVEAINSSSKKEFVNFLNHSLKSTNESKFSLAILRDTNKLDNKTIEEFLKELKELSKY